MPDAPQAVSALVRQIKRRWRRRALLRGAALSLLTLLAAVLVLVLFRVAGLPEAVLVAGGVLGGLAVLGVVGWFMVRPGLRHISDRQVALFVEERVPELEDRLNSAVELGAARGSGERAPADHSALIDRLMDDAARQVSSIPTGTLMDRRQVRQLFYGAAALLGVVLVVGYTSMDRLRTVPSADASLLGTAQQPLLSVDPGNAEVEQGASPEVTVSVREAAGPSVTLYYRQGDDEWQKAVMQQAPGEAVFRHAFQNVQQPIRYFARRGDTRSETYALSLYEFPSVRQVNLTYTYPEYTGQSPRVEDSTRDIRGLQGSTVTLDVKTSGTVERAEMVIGGDERMALESTGEGHYRGHLKLREPGTYTLRLTDANGKQNKFAEQYEITPLEDERPRLTITDPRRDVRPNAIGEVLVAAEAQDDYGLKNVQLKYSVNGAEEQAISLMAPGTERPEQVAGQHRFFLENLDLAPGDVISYYIEADDHAPEAEPEATDMYFVEVRPFDQRFSQARSGGGQGGGQQGGTVVSQQQIITATWKLRRQQGALSDAAFETSRQALVKAQSNLKSNIEKRINNTAFSIELRSDEKSREVVERLRAATTHMEGALDHLKEGQLEEALGPERKALNQLLQADALNKERKVAMRRQQGGGGGSSATEQRMTELMDLELDVSKDKYETQQQRASGQGAGSGRPDETLQRVKELARKQEDLLKGRQASLQGEDKKRRIERLKREQDRLKREANRLARSMRQQQGRQQAGTQQAGRQRQQQAQQRLRRASEQMQRAEQALRRGDEQQARSRQQQALRELDRLQQDLRLAQKDDLRRQIDEMSRDARALREQERQLNQSLQAAAGGGQDAEGQLQHLQAKREEQLNRLRQLKQRAEALQENARQEQPELAEAAGEARKRMEQSDLEQQMQASGQALQEGQLQRARQQGEKVAAGAAQVEKEMQQLKKHLPATEQEKLAQSLKKVRDLKKQLRNMQAQSSQQQGGASPQEGARSSARPSQRQLEQAREALRRMQENLGGSQRAQRQASELQKALRADHTGRRIQGDGADAFFDQEVFERLSALEMELARQLDYTLLQQKIYGPRQDEAPPAYRELVEKYYESLAESK